MARSLPTGDPVLAELLAEASLGAPSSCRRLEGRGFDHEIHLVEVEGGTRVIVRRSVGEQPPEHVRARFLESAGVPVPRLLASTRKASLYEFAVGELLGDLIESRRCTSDHWRLVGTAFRQLHAVRFPAGLSGELLSDRIVLRPTDPVADIRAGLEQCAPGLSRRSSVGARSLLALHELVELAGPHLRAATTSLVHGDVNMWNVIVSEHAAWLIDWDEARIGDPAMGVALLDKHAWLFNRSGLPASFFETYGTSREPNTSLHRVVQALTWLGSDDWESFDKPSRHPERRRRARSWLALLIAYADEIDRHIAALGAVVAASA